MQGAASMNACVHLSFSHERETVEMCMLPDWNEAIEDNLPMSHGW